MLIVISWLGITQPYAVKRNPLTETTIHSTVHAHRVFVPILLLHCVCMQLN